MKKIMFIAVIMMVSFLVSYDSAQALRITVKRVVFEGPKRAEMITVINNTDKEKTYRLGWRHFQMTPDKSLVAIPKGQPMPENIRPVDEMVRFAPRRFTMPPKSSQQIRMMLRMPADIADGEYRSHFWVRPEADIEALRATAKDKSKGKKGSVTLAMLAGVTMPVIVRKGNLSATASIENLTARDSGGFIDVSFSLLRQGDRSLYGDLDYICNPGVGQYMLKVTRGIALYTEVAHRNFSFRIPKSPEQSSCRDLSVSFIESSGFEGQKEKELAKVSVPVSK